MDGIAKEPINVKKLKKELNKQLKRL